MFLFGIVLLDLPVEPTWWMPVRGQAASLVTANEKPLHTSQVWCPISATCVEETVSGWNSFFPPSSPPPPSLPPPTSHPELFSLFEEEPGGTRPDRISALSLPQERVLRRTVQQIVDAVAFVAESRRSCAAGGGTAGPFL